MKEDLIKYVLSNLSHRKTRSFLTILSILIGVMAIFTILSFGMGIKNYINVLGQEAGTDKLFIQNKGVGAPGMDDTFFISDKDIKFVGKIKGVNNVAGMYYKPVSLKYKNQQKYEMAAGMNLKDIRFVEEAFNIDIINGRRLKDIDKDKVVLGYLYTKENKIFKSPVSLSDKLYINGKRFKVVGFYSEVGNPQDDSNVYLNTAEVEGLYPEIKDKFGAAIVRADKNINPKEIAGKITEKLRKFRGEKEGQETFFVQTFEEVLNTFNNIISILNGILIIIALVSVIVASVNIMNTMYTSILERTQEIGIMKAIGAQNKDIMFIFIFESALLGFIGGVIGIVLGYIISSIGGAIAINAGFAMLKPIFPWQLIVANLLGATLLGSISGYFPAKRASMINPAEAVKYDE